MLKDDPDYDFYERIPDTELSAQEGMEQGESHKSLMKHVAALPPEQREVVMLRHYYEMSIQGNCRFNRCFHQYGTRRMRYALINLRKMFEQENANEINATE